MRYRLRTLLIVAGLSPVLFAPLSATFLMLSLREADKANAARILIDWLVDGRPVPGFDELPVNGEITRKKRSFAVACSFIDARTQLSSDSRVRIVSHPEPSSLKRRQDESVAHIGIGLKSESRWQLVLEIENDYGVSSGCQAYRFVFHRRVWGLRGHGELLWDY